MHISTTALSVILLSFLGGSQTVHATQYEDAFGVTHYGFQCEDRVYTKPVVYAAAKNLCDNIPRQSSLQYPSFEVDGYRSGFGYNPIINIEASKLFRLFYSVTPIFADGTLFAFESDSRKNSEGRKVRMEPGPDRLVINEHCNIMGAFTDQDYRIATDKARVNVCTVLNSKEDIRSFQISPGRSRSQSPDRSPERSRSQSPDRSSQHSRSQSPDRSSQQSRSQSPDRSSQHSRSQSPDRFSQHPRGQSPERYSPQSRDQSPEKFTERLPKSPQRSYDETPE